MAESAEKARRQPTIEDRIEDEFQRAVGGIPAIERMRHAFRTPFPGSMRGFRSAFFRPT